MAATTIAVTGKVLKPDGTPAAGGYILIELFPPGSTDDGGEQQVVAKSFRAVIGDDGSVSFSLVPNDVIVTVSGASAYRATFVTGDDRWAFLWSLDSVDDPDPIDIGDITRLSVIASGMTALGPIGGGSSIVSELPEPNAALLGYVVILDTGSGQTAAYMLHRTASGSYEWVFNGAGGIADQIVAVLPDPSALQLGYTVLLDETGTGETAAYQVHRNASDVKIWVQTSNGGV